MNKDVKVTANEAGQVINQSKNNPDYGYVRVAQVRSVFEGGWARTRTLSALISGTVADLKACGFANGQSLPGKIVVCEDVEPFNEANPEKDLKVAGDTGIICTIGGQPIYRKTMYTESAEATDSLIAHDNKDAITAKYEELKAAAEASEGANL